MPVWRNDMVAVSTAALVRRVLAALLPALLLILAVLGSIIFGVATPTEAAGVGAIGGLIMALLRGQLTIARLGEIARNTTRFSSMVFLILIGASMFSLVFRGYGGDVAIQEALTGLPGGKVTALIVVMAVLFLMGFVLDFIEIIFIVVPIVGPVLLAMDIDPLWLGILIAINLQTSFLTPPFGFALFHLRGVAPASVRPQDIYRGVIPFVLILGLLGTAPGQNHPVSRPFSSPGAGRGGFAFGRRGKVLVLQMVQALRSPVGVEMRGLVLPDLGSPGGGGFRAGDGHRCPVQVRFEIVRPWITHSLVRDGPFAGRPEPALPRQVAERPGCGAVHDRHDFVPGRRNEAGWLATAWITVQMLLGVPSIR